MGGGRWLVPVPPPPPLAPAHQAIELKAEKERKAATATRARMNTSITINFFRNSEFVRVYNRARIVRKELGRETATAQSRP